MSKLRSKLQQLIRLMGKKQKQSRATMSDLPAVNQVLNENVVKKLMHMIERTHEQEYTCEETFAVLDEYVELAASEEDVAALMPLVKRHIDMCVDCREQYETLMEIIQADFPSLADIQ